MMVQVMGECLGGHKFNEALKQFSLLKNCLNLYAFLKPMCSPNVKTFSLKIETSL